MPSCLPSGTVFIPLLAERRGAISLSHRTILRVARNVPTLSRRIGLNVLTEGVL